jgi:hypothetical protein
MGSLDTLQRMTVFSRGLAWSTLVAANIPGENPKIPFRQGEILSMILGRGLTVPAEKIG